MYFRNRKSNADQKQAGFRAESGDKTILQAASFALGIRFTNSYFVIRGAHLARSIIENKCWKDSDRIFIKVLTCGLKEGIKAVSFLRV
jgi:hypothetical protein